MRSLYLKHLAVDTPLASVGQQARWILHAPHRFRHPELWDLYMEDKRTATGLEALIGHDDNCVDVGAHIGSVLADVRRLAPRGAHVAIEPVPEKAGWLRKKFADVEIIEAATSDEPGTAMFHYNLDAPGFSSLDCPSDSEAATTSYEVELVRLDDVLGDRRVDFLKIDVEGNELPSLRGGDSMLTRDRPKILFECVPDTQLERFGYTRSDLFGFFEDREYDVYSIVDFVFGCEPQTRAMFVRAGTYPFHGFNFFALPKGTPVTRLL